MASTYYAQITNDGTISNPVAASSGDVPPGMTALTGEQYATIIASLGHVRYVNGVVVLQPLPTPTPPDLGAFKAAVLQQIDSAAETARQAFLTPGAGQAMEYGETLDDAHRALLSTATLAPADYPWLAAEQQAYAAVGVTVSVLDVAHQVVAIMAQWTTAGAAIKLIRRTAKLRVAAATDPGTVATVAAGLAWPRPS